MISTKVMGLQFSIRQIWKAHVVISEVGDVGRYSLLVYDIGNNNPLVIHVNDDGNIVSVQLHDRRQLVVIIWRWCNWNALMDVLLIVRYVPPQLVVVI